MRAPRGAGRGFAATSHVFASSVGVNIAVGAKRRRRAQTSPPNSPHCCDFIEAVYWPPESQAG